MDAKVRDKLGELMKVYKAPENVGGRAAYSRALQMAQEIKGSYPEARDTEHFVCRKGLHHRSLRTLHADHALPR